MAGQASRRWIVHGSIHALASAKRPTQAEIGKNDAFGRVTAARGISVGQVRVVAPHQSYGLDLRPGITAGSATVIDECAEDPPCSGIGPVIPNGDIQL